MNLLELAAVLAAGMVAGTVNTIIGAGTLLTFPLLLAIGVPPLTANVSNSVGLVPAAVTGAWGYRRELAGQIAAVARMAVLAGVGAVAGALLLLVAPPDMFTVVVPWLLVLAAGLAAVQPRITEVLRHRESLAALTAGTTLAESPPRPADAHTRPLTLGLGTAITTIGVYGGYFGAAQGVILLAALGIGWSADLHRANGAKVVLAGAANLVGAAIFIVSGVVDWQLAALIAVGSAIGGAIGARLGRRIPSSGLRVVIVVVGLATAVTLWIRG
jgi:uncharacterized membrane protein YfcA